jgi:hypothetical protein
MYNIVNKCCLFSLLFFIPIYPIGEKIPIWEKVPLLDTAPRCKIVGVVPMCPDIQKVGKYYYMDEYSIGIKRSTGNAYNWENCSMIPYNVVNVDGDIFYLQDGKELFISSDSGETWEKVCTMPGSLEFRLIGVNKYALYAEGEDDDIMGGIDKQTWIYSSTDKGKTWHSLGVEYVSSWFNNIREVRDSSILIRDFSIGDRYLGTEYHDSILISLDGGKKWEKYSTPGEPITLVGNVLFSEQKRKRSEEPGERYWRIIARTSTYNGTFDSICPGDSILHDGIYYHFNKFDFPVIQYDKSDYSSSSPYHSVLTGSTSDTGKTFSWSVKTFPLNNLSKNNLELGI